MWTRLQVRELVGKPWNPLNSLSSPPPAAAVAPCMHPRFKVSAMHGSSSEVSSCAFLTPGGSPSPPLLMMSNVSWKLKSIKVQSHHKWSGSPNISFIIPDFSDEEEEWTYFIPIQSDHWRFFISPLIKHWLSVPDFKFFIGSSSTAEVKWLNVGARGRF